MNKTGTDWRIALTVRAKVGGIVGGAVAFSDLVTFSDIAPESVTDADRLEIRNIVIEANARLLKLMGEVANR